MTLKEKRILFSKLICEHIIWLHSIGYQPALAEGMDRRTEKDPSTDHMKNSLHEIGLAQDIDLYDSTGKWLKYTEDHLVSGLVWEKRHELCCWGGRFGDGNHYSFAHLGRK